MFFIMEGFVYKIQIGSDFYIGSTKQKLSQRAAEHNRQIINGNKSPFYKFCRENDIKKVECIQLERINCNDREELYILEQEWIDKLNPTLNKLRVRTDRKEYVKQLLIKNKERIKEWRDKYNSIYYQKNKDRLATKYTCICGKKLSYSGKSAHEKTKKHLKIVAEI